MDAVGPNTAACARRTPSPTTPRLLLVIVGALELALVDVEHVEIRLALATATAVRVPRIETSALILATLLPFYARCCIFLLLP